MDTLFQLGVNLSKGLRDEDKDIARVLARKNDPQTSKDAAEKMVVSGELNRQEKLVYEAIRGHYRRFGDFTTKDIAKWLSWPQRYNMSYHKAYDICRKRFSGLRDKGKIETTGGRRDACQVWRLK